MSFITGIGKIITATANKAVKVTKPQGIRTFVPKSNITKVLDNEAVQTVGAVSEEFKAHIFVKCFLNQI